ncbi:MAG: hypothetical protein M1833_003250 [Piccolia ochrophora]|nr:MAG: hypothetical protein M1833_003250 [Piccolia ochrophora]
MSRISIPLDAITSRLNLQGRFDSVRSQSLTSRFAHLRPVSEFLDLKRLSKPHNFSEVQTRVNYNLSYFSSNYAAVFVMLSIYSLLTNLSLLFVIILAIGGTWGIGKLEGNDLDLGFARFTTSQLYTGLLVLAVPLGILASPITTALWLIGATGTNRECFFRGGGLGGRPRTPYSTPQWGRPPGASVGKRRRRWEEEMRRQWEEAQRFEEIETDDARTEARNGPRNRSFAGDELHFDGIDLDARRGRRGGRHKEVIELSSSSDTSEDSDDVDAGAMQVALRDKEDMLVQTAMARIERARAKGKRSVNLTEPEIQALERKGKLPGSSRSRGGAGGRSSEGSGTERMRKSSGYPPPAHTSGPGPTRRKGKAESKHRDSPPLPTGYAYPPVGFFPPPATQRSRSSSQSAAPQPVQSRKEASFQYQYPPQQSRYFSLPETVPPMGRPRSSRGSEDRLPLPDDPDWTPPSRSRSAAHMFPGYNPFEYQTHSPPSPQLPPEYRQGRRPVPDVTAVQYSPIIRKPPGSSYTTTSSGASVSDPSLTRRRPPPDVETEEESSPEDESADEVVEVKMPSPQSRRRGGSVGRKTRGRR